MQAVKAKRRSEIASSGRSVQQICRFLSKGAALAAAVNRVPAPRFPVRKDCKQWQQ
jgi:hypothetical protein